MLVVNFQATILVSRCLSLLDLSEYNCGILDRVCLHVKNVFSVADPGGFLRFLETGQSSD